MKAVVQRVNRCRVTVGEEVTGEIAKGILILLGVEKGDVEKDAEYLGEKISKLRIFADENDKMNLSVKDINGSVLVVSQFTLCGDCKKGTRPSYDKAMNSQEANRLYEYFVSLIKKMDIECQTGKFQAHMNVELENDGPVTLIVESGK